MNARERRKARPESFAHLSELIRPGDTLYTVLRHVSQSGMMRHIDVEQIRDNEPYWLSWHVANVLDYPTADSGALKVGGAGMDMGFHVIYSLSRSLFPDGFDCIGEGWCPSNDHFNDRERNYDVTRRHRDGGYALRQRWL